jgi:hypothetical protein
MAGDNDNGSTSSVPVNGTSIESTSNKVEEPAGPIAGESESSDLDLIKRIFDQWDQYYQSPVGSEFDGMEDCAD